MRRLLKTFPDKGSSQNVAELKKEIEKEISNIKETHKILKAETQVPSGIFAGQTAGKFDENLLGDLLFYLRTGKMMSTLMLCRQIEHIEIEDKVAYLRSDTTDLSEIVSNEKHKSQLDSFFKSKGLSFKIKEKSKEIDPIDSLREFFGEKLIVK